MKITVAPRFVLIFCITIGIAIFSQSVVQAATYRNRVAQVPTNPNSTETVRVWIDSDTVFGETAGVEYLINGAYTKVLGTYDASSYPGANWRADIPAQANGTLVKYQLFTRNQSGSDYGFTGFNWSYTVQGGAIQYLGLKHDTFNSFYRTPFGAVTSGSIVTLRFRTDVANVQQVFLKVYQYNPANDTTNAPVEYAMPFEQTAQENGINYDFYKINYTVPNATAIIYYKFRIVSGGETAYYFDAFQNEHDNLGQGGDGVAAATEGFNGFQITVYPATFTTPAWFNNAAVYQIFPDRFRNGDTTNDWCRAGSTTGCPALYGAPPSSNIVHTTWNEQMVDPRATGNNNAYSAQFYGGDLQGVTQKLDYIKSLGFDTIYLNPIFKARSNHGYDADNYLAIAPQLGGDTAFNQLKAAADARGMRLILDMVYNHMSQDSEYFDYFNRLGNNSGACRSLSSTYRSWFNFYNNNVPCNYTDYEGWFGFGGLPVFNKSNPVVRDFFFRSTGTNVTKFWYTRGASGYRFDVATDIPHDYWNEFRPYAKSYKADAPLIGEIFGDASQYLAGDQLDGVMNYRFRKNVLGFTRNADWEDNDNSGSNKIVGLTPSQFNRAMLAIREDYPLPAQMAMLNLIDSHDTNRALYTLVETGDNGLTEAKQRLKLAATIQFTWLGVPMVYYGDEVAINAPSLANNSNGLAEDDPYNRAPYPWTDETGNQNVYGPADTNVMNYYALLGAIRQSHPALRTGSLTTLLMGDLTASTTDNNTFAYARVLGNDKIIVILNNGSTTNTATVPVGAYFPDGTTLTDYTNNGSFNFGDPQLLANFTVSGGNVTVNIPARSGVILGNTTTTAAQVSLTGRIVNNRGGALRRVTVALRDLTTGETRTTQTDGDGFYRFYDLTAGASVLVAPRSKIYAFMPESRFLTLTESLIAADFMGNLQLR
jgi:glycosidase